MVSEIKSIHDAVVYLHLTYWIVAKHFIKGFGPKRMFQTYKSKAMWRGKLQCVVYNTDCAPVNPQISTTVTERGGLRRA